MSNIRILDTGFVELVDYMGSDQAICQMARISKKNKTPSEDRSLIRYLMRHRHTSPFERCEFVFHIKLPIFVARQWVRHRTASLNEYSMRYSEAIDDYYVPDELFPQSDTNKQCSGVEPIAESDTLRGLIGVHCEQSLALYRELRDSGVSREISRIVIPVAGYTEWYWKCDLKNLLNFLSLRADKHAQKEIRVYAEAMIEIIRPLVPLVMEAWEDYDPYRGGMILTRGEILLLASKMFGQHNTVEMSKREIDEYEAKLVRIRDEAARSDG